MDSSHPRRTSTAASQHAAPRPSDSPRTAATRGPAASGAIRAVSSDSSPSLGTSWATAEDPVSSNKDSARASISHALRVQIPSVAPPVRASIPTTPKSASHPRTGQPTASPRLPQSAISSNPSASISNSRSVADSLGSFSFPPTPPSLTATSPPRGIASPRLSSVTSSSASTANSPRTYPQPTAGGEGDLFAASGSSASGGGASGSLRRKAPPPLALRMDEEMNQKGKGMARGDSSDSSELGEDWQAERYRVQQQWPARRYESRDVKEGSSREATQKYSAPLPSHGQVQRSDSKDEARDTLSSLFKFPSPQLGTSIPSSHLDFSTIDSTIEDLEADDEAGEDDTTTTNLSFLSSSSDGTREYTGEVPRPQGSSLTGYDAPRQYTGLGLGLPFSMSAAANLSSLSPTLSPPSSSIQQRATSDEQGGFPRSPSGGERSRSASGTSGPESPVTDRSKLIGLGELATPRWTSGVLERRWGTPYDEKRKVSREGDEVDATEPGHDPMPPISRKLSADSPSIARQPAARQAPRPISSYEPSSSARSASYAMHPSALFPTTVSSQSKATPPKVSSLHEFTNEPTPFAQPNFSRQQQLQHPPQSPVYSLEAVSIPDDLSGLADPPQETLRHSQLVNETPSAQQFESMALQKRRSMVGTTSAPTSAAAGGSWTTAPSPGVVGLGFDYESQGGEAKAADASAQAQRRASSGSMQSTHARRSSTGRAYSVDAGAKLPTKTTAHRRQSASKSGFAHLPPSPAAPPATQALANTGVPIIPFTLPTTTASASTTAASAPPSTPGRTPDMARLSHHSHHSSPSVIAASILRQTRDPEGRDIDMDVAAAADEGTAEALRKLDGLSSPRLSKVFSSSGGPVSTGSRSRTTSRSGEAMTPPALLRRDSEEVKTRRRTRSSTGASGNALAKDVEQAMTESKSPPRPASSHATGGTSATAHSPHSPALASTPGSTTAQMPRSPLIPPSETRSSSSTARALSQTRPGSSGHGAGSDVPFPSASPFKRGSSSSASLTAGTSTSASGSHDSTSGTSISGSSVATTAAKSSSLKNRRGSVGSDVSSNMGSGEGPASKSERSESAGDGDVLRSIPPVPPIPKDWETYRPSTAGTSTPSAQNSPRFDADFRRPSESSSYAESALLSPRAADMEPSLSSSSVASGKGHPRKWSLSNAFSKSSKSPKAPSVKESSSYTDLLAAGRDRKSSFGSHISEPGFTRRMAASTNDIVGLANGTRDPPPLLGSLGRNSYRHDKHASAISRARTVSQSSSSTTTTANAFNAPPSSSSSSTPAVVTTSPGRSRSSLLSPRRTPSGIPFFSRKSSSGSTSAAPASPNIETTESPPEEKSGRKSILGLNFLRNSTSKKDKIEKTPPSPVFKRQTIGTVPSATRAADRTTDEFGRRASVAAAKTSSTGITRKRGKTLGSVDDTASFNSKPASLPPMQMPGLSPVTVRRVDSLSSTHSSSSISSKAMATPTRIQPPGTRASKLQESVKANLPTIAGSPSTHTFPLMPLDEPRAVSDDSPTATPPPKSHTPTKIPRLYQQRSAAVTSPRLTIRGEASREPSPSVPSSVPVKSATRRLSTYSSATPDATVPLASSTSSSNLFFHSENDSTTSEFGFAPASEKVASTRRRLDSEPSQIPRSRSTTLGGSLASSRTSKDPLDSLSSSRTSTAVPRTHRRQSVIGEEGGKTSATPIRAQARTTSLHTIKSTPAQTASDSSSSSGSTLAASASRRVLPKSSELSSSTRRSSAASTADSVSSSRTSRTMNITSKMAIPSRMSKSSTTPTLSPAPTESGRSSVASSAPSIAEEELRGDEEMSAYVRRQQAKKTAAGVSSETIRKMFEFPDPTEPLPPLDSRDALSLYARYLSPYEKEEIKEYEKVYFVGPNCDKKQSTKENSTNNHGFDDDRGDYLLVPHDHIMYRYEVIDVLGKGSFGQVLQCRDHKTGEMVAIKIIRNKKRFHHQALVEIKVLDNLVQWDPDEKHFVIRMVESFTFRGHLCIVTELLSINLYELVKANSFAGFSTTLIRRFTTQILGSLSLLRHHRVVHCDLKPENILLKHPAKSAIKVIDFGSSCFEHEKVYTYIQSRFYRSPEVILGMNYHMAIDMWSLGCIIAEMYTGYPIFPGENEQEQLACIMEVMGLPEKYLVDRSSRKRLFFDSTGAPRPVVNSKGRRRRPGTKTLAQVLKSDDELFIDFIAKCLTWDPDRRLKPDPAMRHPWIVASRARALSPPIPPRTSRSSLAPSQTSSGSNNASSPQISTPRKKVASTATASTAPVQRTRASSSSTSTSTAPARLSSKGSLGLPPSSTRYTLRSS